MAMQDYGKYKTAFFGAVAVIVIIAIWGALDVQNSPYSGYTTDGNNTITQVFAESPAEQAGFMVGDFITSSGGISAQDTKALLRRQRASQGETRTFVLERSGESVTLDLTYSALPGSQLFIAYMSAFIGVCFLFFGMRPYLQVQNRNTTLLAVVGLCLGHAFVNNPYITSYALRLFYISIANVIVLFGLAALLHFMMAFPTEKAMLAKKNMLKILYAPAVFVVLSVLYFFIAQPAATSGVNTFFNIAFGLFIAAYLGLTAVSMVHSFVKASPSEREAKGLSFMLFGTVVGLAPIVISAIVGLISPKAVLPGNQYYFLTMVLIPISLGMATMKTEGSAAPKEKAEEVGTAA